MNPEEIFQQTDRLLKSDVELKKIIQNDEGLTATEVAQKLALALHEKPLLQKRLEDLSQNLTYQKKNGQVVLNPVFEGALAERVSLDGDIPELRAGALQEGMRPAVPVKTSSRNLLEVGFMLERASEEVRDLLMEAQPLEETQLALFDGIEGYKKGELPALREVPSPSPLTLSSLPEEKKRELVWRALSTTQGRRSLLSPIQEGIIQARPDLQFGKNPPEGAEGSSWTLQAFGPEDLDPHFSFIDTAISSISKQIPRSATHFHIEPSNAVSERLFGWIFHFWEER